VEFLKRATGTSGLPNQFDTGRDWDWVSSVGGNHGHRAFYAQSNNPGSRRTRLAVAVHSDDRHLDSGIGELVTMVPGVSLVLAPLTQVPHSSSTALDSPGV
jgi:hypothetical protein